MSDNQSVSLIQSMSKHWIIRLWTAFQAQDKRQNSETEYNLEM